ncbi:ArsR/SmtB family transcription factor [Roseibium album]|uniref:Helix-turn-helix domain protein n=1 Tax=Roseibium album TaxID=311410 RepID=A0A0M6ZUP1_9HYPH|nr:metalloregulator ArsR/SmtB family transcription factor [Roseibium album]CTQ58183.1 Helix-turn-helix domain protein [Roseibium album]CTQ65780.1 Helix-turn-helix domain protein [Roseibium album]CTQ70664.1 Helix-turn-helix domain protein [Roseibium album]
MDINEALSAFGALSQKTRLDVFRLLINAGPEGMSAGDIGEALGVRQNTMSANLSVLLQAGLVRNEREGRSIRYYADMDGTKELLTYLVADCCGGHPELCAQVMEAIACRK